MMYSQIVPLTLLGAPLVSAYGLIVSATGDLGGHGASSVPQISASSGVLKMVYHQINGDGAGPISCSVSADASGNSFKAMMITTNVPGTNGKSNAANVDFPLVASMPASTRCTGTVGSITNACVVKCQNPVDPFGSNFVVQQKSSSADSTTPSELQQPLELRTRAHNANTTTTAKGTAKGAKAGAAKAATAKVAKTAKAKNATAKAANAKAATAKTAKAANAKAANAKAARHAPRNVETLIDSIQQEITSSLTGNTGKEAKAAKAFSNGNAAASANNGTAVATAKTAAKKGAAKNGAANAASAAANSTAAATVAASNGTAATASAAKKGKAKTAKGKVAKTAAKAKGARDIASLLDSVESIVQDFTGQADQNANNGQAAASTNQAGNATASAVGEKGAAKAAKAAEKGAAAKNGGAAANGTAAAATASTAAVNGTAAVTAKKGKAGKAAKTAAKAAGKVKANKAGRSMRRGARLQY